MKADPRLHDHLQTLELIYPIRCRYDPTTKLHESSYSCEKISIPYSSQSLSIAISTNFI